jgi:voltage-gated potassium channel
VADKPDQRSEYTIVDEVDDAVDALLGDDDAEVPGSPSGAPAAGGGAAGGEKPDFDDMLRSHGLAGLWRNQHALEAYEKQFNLWILLISLFFLPVLLLTYFDTTAWMDTVLWWTRWGFWLVFLLDYSIRFYCSVDKTDWMKTDIDDLIIVVGLPLCNLFATGVAPALLALVILWDVREHATVIFRQKRLMMALLVVAGTAVVISVLVYSVEHKNPNANITSMKDALWWAAATITTIGYGDRSPVTTPGRLLAVILMLVGIGVFGVIAAALAAWFVAEDQQSEFDDLKREFLEMNKALEESESEMMKQQLKELHASLEEEEGKQLRAEMAELHDHLDRIEAMLSKTGGEAAG